MLELRHGLACKRLVTFAMCCWFCAAGMQAQVYRSVPGDATFLGRPSDLHSGESGYVFLCDVNHDGNLDIVVNDYAASTLVVLWGDGAGHFSQGPTSTLNPGASGYTHLVDMNGDGVADFLFSDGLNEFNIAYGNPDGSFQPTTTYKLSFPKSKNQNEVFSVNALAADFNGDGKLDVAVAGQSGWEVLLNTGTGFQRSAEVLARYGNVDTGLAAGDINGDGIPDLAYSSEFQVMTYLGKGDGTFGPGTALNLPNPQQNQWEEVDLADWNGDGKLDLLVSNALFSRTYLLAGNGDGTFQAPSVLSWPYLSGDYQVADFNNDGIPDIAGFGGAHVTVFPGLGGGKFGTPKSYAVDYSPAYGDATFSGMAVGSLRDNGKLDFAVPVSDGVNLLFNTGSGFEETPGKLPAPGSVAFEAADLNGDGLTDLVTVGTNGIEVFWGTGKAASPFVAGPVSSSGTLDVGYLALGDFNGDGFLDVAATVVSLTMQTTQIAICLGDGQGHFGAPIYTTVELGTKWLAAADLNGDGKLDLVTSSVSVQFGNGDGTFQAPTVLSIFSVSPVRIADLNGDGKPDIVANINTSYPDPGLEVFLNRGDGTFGKPQLYGVVQQGYVEACDINGDGIPDILTDLDSPIPFVLIGNGNGTFSLQTAESPFSLFDGSAFACGNFSGTSIDPEIAMVSNYDASVLVSKYLGAGAFTFNFVGWGTGIGPLGIIAGKFHGPSSLDDLVVLNGDGTISTLLNITGQGQ